MFPNINSSWSPIAVRSSFWIFIESDESIADANTHTCCAATTARRAVMTRDLHGINEQCTKRNIKHITSCNLYWVQGSVLFVSYRQFCFFLESLENRVSLYGVRIASARDKAVRGHARAFPCCPTGTYITRVVYRYRGRL